MFTLNVALGAWTDDPLVAIEEQFDQCTYEYVRGKVREPKPPPGRSTARRVIIMLVVMHGTSTCWI